MRAEVAIADGLTALRQGAAAALLAAMLADAPATAAAASGPSFDCRRVEPGSIAAQVCADPALSALDRQLARVYAAAKPVAARTRPRDPLVAEQRGWIKGRDDCWKEADRRACIERETRRRIAELQARYRLLAPHAPVRLACDGDPRNEVVLHYFDTEPPSLIAERGDQSAWMLGEPMASGTRYVGRNESLAEHQGRITVVWGYAATPLHCQALR